LIFITKFRTVVLELHVKGVMKCVFISDGFFTNWMFLRYMYILACLFHFYWIEFHGISMLKLVYPFNHSVLGHLHCLPLLVTMRRATMDIHFIKFMFYG
jgi:hypothetical protein